MQSSKVSGIYSAYEISSASWWADFNDPVNMLEMWATNSGNNYPQFGR